MRLIAVGAFYLDTILTVERYPEEDEKFRASRIERRGGGNCPNTLEVLQQLVPPSPAKTASLTLFAMLPSSSSAASRFIKSTFGPAVDLSKCLHREDHIEAASSYVVRSLASDSRTIVNYNQLPEMTTDEFVALADELSDDGDTWYHFEGRIPNVTLECLRYLRLIHPAAKISVEVEKPGRPGLQDLAALADVVFYSKSWAQGQGYQDPEHCLRDQASLTPQAFVTCCTWGDQGSSVLELPSMTYSHTPAFTTNGHKVVDTLGAGDTFIAGMLYGLCYHGNEWPVTRMLLFANELAGRKVLQDGFSGLGSLMQHRI